MRLEFLLIFSFNPCFLAFIRNQITKICDSGRSDEDIAFYSFDVLITTPVTGGFFDIGYDIDAVCLALSYSSELVTFSPLYSINLYYYGIDYDLPIDYFYLNNSVFHNPNYNFVGILGPDLAKLAITLVKTNSSNNLNFISFGPLYLSSIRDSSEDMNQTFRLTLPTTELTSVYLNLFKEYSWSRAALILNPEILDFQNAGVKIYETFADNGIDIHRSYIYSFFTVHDLLNLTRTLGPEGLDYKVLILLLEDQSASKMVCALQQTSIGGAGYAIFGLAYWNRVKWGDYESECNSSHIASILDYSLYVSMSGVGWSGNNNLTDVGISPQSYLKTILNVTSNGNEQPALIPHAYYTGLISDALWTLLAALNKTMSEKNGSSSQSQDYSLTANFQSQMSKHLGETEFLGLSGLIMFNDDGNRVVKESDGSCYAVVFQSVQETLQARQELLMPGDVLRSEIVFANGQVPSTNRVFETSNIQAVDLLVLIPTAGGVLFSLASMAAFYIFRQKPAIRMLSPRINVLCGFGSTISFAAILGHLLYNMNKTITVENNNCVTSAKWGCSCYDLLIRLGYFISFACLVSKLYRLHVIFSQPGKKSVPTDLKLICYVLIGACCQIGIHISVLIRHPPCGIPIEVGVASDELMAGEKIYSYFLVCEKVQSKIPFIGNLLTSVLVVAAVYFCWTTRKLKISVLNENHKVSTLVITLLALETMRVLTNVIFQNSFIQLSSYFSISETTIFENWIIITHVFLPGLVRLIAKPNWKPDTSVMPPGLDHSRDIQRCLNDFSNIHGVENLLNLYVKTYEMWSDMKESCEMRHCVHQGQSRYRTNSLPDLYGATFLLADEGDDGRPLENAPTSKGSVCEPDTTVISLNQ